MKYTCYCLFLFATVLSISFSQISSSGLVAYYPFNGNANDESGNGNNGTNRLATWTSDRFGIANSACQFNGTSSYIEIPDNDLLDLTNNFSISVWIKPSQVQARWIICKHKAYVGDDGSWELVFDSPDHVYFHCSPFTAPPEVFSRGTLSINQWHHVAVTYDKAQRIAQMYLDGKLDTTLTKSLDIRNTSRNMLIGAEEMDWVGHFFAGIIDEIYIYNRVLSFGEIKLHYNETRIFGSKFNDLNCNGIRDLDEPGLSGWKIKLSGTKIDSTLTDSNGNYYFYNLGPGAYTLSEENQIGWMQTLPSAGSYNINLESASYYRKDFGNFAGSPINGKVFDDINNNGIKNSDEPGLAGWTIKLNGVRSDSIVTDAEGNYRFLIFDIGTYTVQAPSALTCWVQTAPTAPDLYTFNIDTLGKTIVGDFGFYSPSAMKFEVDHRWNIISMPVQLEDKRKSSIFPNASSPAFMYASNYKQVDTMECGIGYWLKFPYAYDVWMCGSHLNYDTIDIRMGWNLIGALSVPIVVSSITSDPPALVTSKFYGYSNGYLQSDTLFPGKGYWVKVREGGTLFLSSGSAKYAANRIKIVPTSEMPPPPPDELTSVTTEELPKEFALTQNYPNPFNPSTVIRYQLPVSGSVSLKVYDVLGREVVALVDGVQPAGYKSVEFNAGSLPSGVYFYRLQANSFVETKKLLILK